MALAVSTEVDRLGLWGR